MNGLAIEVRGERLHLFPERAVYWERTKSLLVADAHFGKAATFRAASIPVPRGTTMEGIARLDSLVNATGAARIVFLGDFLHARAGRAPETLSAFQRWRETHAGVRFVLVRGNHDRQAGDPPSELGVDCVDAPLVESPFVLAHHPGTPQGIELPTVLDALRDALPGTEVVHAPGCSVDGDGGDRVARAGGRRQRARDGRRPVRGRERGRRGGPATGHLHGGRLACERLRR